MVENLNLVSCGILHLRVNFLKTMLHRTPAPHFQTRKEFIKYMRSKMTKRYSYKFGRKYPGVVIGHNHDVEVPRVPSYMGWLWNIKTLGINKVWTSFSKVLPEFLIQMSFRFVAAGNPARSESPSKRL
jgi:hypothetical protein